MKARIYVGFGLVVLLAAGLLGFRYSAATPQGLASEPEYVPNEVLVKFKPLTLEAAVIQVIESIQGQIVGRHGSIVSAGLWAENRSEYRSFLSDPDLFLVKVPPALGTKRAITELLSDVHVEFAEKNFIYKAALTPDDTYYSLQWGLHNTGYAQSGGTADADIDAPEAWEEFTGSDDITIAVIDTGIDFAHVDLEPNIWTNAGETGGGKETDGVDNDGNGYIDDWHGWDFVNDDNDPTDDRYIYFHGTHVSGIAGARGNNSSGIAGVCWYAKLMPLKLLDSGGNGSTSDAISAIDYAVSVGVQVINASWGGTGASSSLIQAIERAKASGILFVAAAGNTSPPLNINTDPHYPASYDIDNIISVLATTSSDTLASYSNYGSYAVDLGAPGGTDLTQNNYNIFSDKPGQQYQHLAGTSMATPFVSGAAALVLGQRPTIDWWQAKTMILKSIDTLASLQGKARTSGRLNAHSLLTYSTPVLPDAPTNLQGDWCENGPFVDISLTWTDNADNESGFKIYMQSSPGIFSYLGSTSANVTTFWLTEVGAGTYYFYVRAYKTDGESPKTATITVHTF